MSDGVLSQEEIDALLRSDAMAQEAQDDGGAVQAAAEPAPAAAAAPAPVADGTAGELNDSEQDAIGEVANMVMGSAATALSTLIGKKVEITTPRVEITTLEQIRHDYPLPYLLVNVEYVAGLEGASVMIIRDKDACVIVDLMMMGDGTSPPVELTDMHISAMAEAMNQMMGASATALSTILKKRVEISPPSTELINLATDEVKGAVGQQGVRLAKVAFHIQIEDLVDSEMMQLIPLDFAREMARNLIGNIGTAEAVEEVAAAKPALAPEPEIAQQPPMAAQPVTMPGPQPNVVQMPSQPPVSPAPAFTAPAAAPPPVMPGQGMAVQPAQFAPLQGGYQTREIGNIDLILDVPLQITVELGKARKTIREILALSSGSVVELDKLAGEPVDLLVNGKLLAKGEVVVIDENFGVRVTDIISPVERVTNLQ